MNIWKMMTELILLRWSPMRERCHIGLIWGVLQKSAIEMSTARVQYLSTDFEHRLKWNLISIYFEYINVCTKVELWIIKKMIESSWPLAGTIVPMLTFLIVEWLMNPGGGIYSKYRKLASTARAPVGRSWWRRKTYQANRWDGGDQCGQKSVGWSFGLLCWIIVGLVRLWASHGGEKPNRQTIDRISTHKKYVEVSLMNGIDERRKTSGC